MRPLSKINIHATSLASHPATRNLETLIFKAYPSPQICLSWEVIMRNALLLLLLLSTGVTLSAQQSLVGHPSSIFVQTSGTGCPVNFDAQLNSQPQRHFIQEQKTFSDSPLLDLTFGHRKWVKIIGASITVHGVSGSNSAQYFLVSRETSQDKTQTFKVDRPSKSVGLARVQVLVTKMTFVRWAEITELRYADGSIWHPSALAQCHARPSGFHLVSQPAQ
jgi:hypothetical protein